MGSGRVSQFTVNQVSSSTHVYMCVQSHSVLLLSLFFILNHEKVEFEDSKIGHFRRLQMILRVTERVLHYSLARSTFEQMSF